MAQNDSSPATTTPREHFASRLGFILISAGCAVGLGNVWRFPFIVGQYGGAAFILLYLIFLVILGLPVMVMEFAVGRASQRSAALAFDELQPSRRWHWFSWWAYIGCMLLMMFYTTVCGWMLAYTAKMAAGTFNGLDAAVVGNVFTNMLANPGEMVGWMLVVVVLGFVVCSFGLQKGVERLAAADVVNYSLSDFDTLSKVAAAEGYIADKDIAKLTAFQKNPQDPAWMEL